MAHLSKVLIRETFKNNDCKDIFHPWNSSCFHANLQMMISALKGSFCFYSILHLMQFFARFKSNKKINKSQMLISFIRSVSFAVSFATSIISLNCFFKRLIGRIDYQIVTLVVPLLSGLSSFLDSPERREITATTFITMALEAFYKRLVMNNVILRSKRFETISFMVINAFMMCFLRKRQELNGRSDNIWFLIPSPLKSEENQENNNSKNSKKICHHENSCVNAIIKDTANYAFVGLIMSGIRFVMAQLMSPVKTNQSFNQWKNFQIPLFISSYVFIYKAVSCYLCKRRGKDCLKQTFLCGLLSGISYWFNPSLTILFTALTVLSKMCGKQIRENYELPNLPYIELCFIFSNVFILQSSVFHAKTVPTLFTNMVSMCTEKKGIATFIAIREALQSMSNQLLKETV